jgi:ABC-2 type transport system permease protein
VNILRKSFDDRRRGFIGWAIGIIALSAFILAFYPSIKSSPQFEEAYKQLPDALRSIVGDVSLTSPAGYLERQLFLYTIPILFFVFSIGHGADAIAGEEQRHTLDLLMSTPVSRARAVVEKFGATFAGLTGLGLVLLLTLVVGTRLVGMGIGVARLAAATVGAVLLGLAIGALALAIGSATGKKGLAVGVASTAATACVFCELTRSADRRPEGHPAAVALLLLLGRIAAGKGVPDRSFCGPRGDHPRFLCRSRWPSSTAATSRCRPLHRELGGRPQREHHPGLDCLTLWTGN